MFSFAESSQKCGEHSVLVIVDVPFKGLKEKAIPLGQLLAVLYFLIQSFGLKWHSTCVWYEKGSESNLFIFAFSPSLLSSVIPLSAAIVSYFGYKSPQRPFRLSNKGLLEIIFTNGSRLFSFPGNQHHWEPVLVLTHHHPLVKKSTDLALLYTDT